VTARGCPDLAVCGRVFKNSKARNSDCFAVNLGITTSFNAELTGAVVAIETALKKCWPAL
jgi:hypothetical protein